MILSFVHYGTIHFCSLLLQLSIPISVARKSYNNMVQWCGCVDFGLYRCPCTFICGLWSFKPDLESFLSQTLKAQTTVSSYYLEVFQSECNCRRSKCTKSCSLESFNLDEVNWKNQVNVWVKCLKMKASLLYTGFLLMTVEPKTSGILRGFDIMITTSL